MGLRDTRSIGRIVVDPTSPNVVYVAAVGHLWGPNPERGVFKTTDGGRTWTKVLYVDDNTGATDIVIDPRNSQVLFAAMYQRQRRAWGFVGGGPGGGIYKTTNGGVSWTKLTNGLPTGDLGRIGLDLFAGDGQIVYATVEASGGVGGGRAGRDAGGAGSAQSSELGPGLYRTRDGGTTWERVNTTNTRPMYFSQVRVDPSDQNRVYMLGSNRGFYNSDDGGKTFRDTTSGVHGEDHALWIDPRDGNHMLVGGDGGVSVSWDRGRTWLFRDNLPIGQFYEIDVDNRIPFTVCGGLQDNGLWCTPSASRDRLGLSNRDAWNIGGGDGFYARFDRADSNFAYEESQEGGVAKVNLNTLEHLSVKPPGNAGEGRGQSGQPAYRFNWDSPILVSSVDPKVVYMGANVLFKSTDRGGSWKAISPDLTSRTDRDTLSIMGVTHTGATLSGNDGVTFFPSLTTICESPLDARVLYTGADDGQLEVTRDGGVTWTNLTGRVVGLPPRTYVSSVSPSRFAAGRVYASFDGHYNDDYRPYVYVSEDFGQTWRSIAAGLPETSINKVREDPRNPHVLILAHSRGVHVSTDDGATWMSLDNNMPPVPTDDAIVQIRDGALVVGTHGRGIWILDNFTPVEGFSANALAGSAVLAPIGAGHEMTAYAPQAWFGTGEFFAPNPQFEVAIYYYLRNPATAPVSIAITDAQGQHVRTLPGPANAGMNRAVWDMRMDSPLAGIEIPAGRGGAAGGGRGGRGGGGGARNGGAGGAAPLVLPGKYQIALSVPGIEQPLRGDVLVDADPLPNLSDADRRARQAVLMTAYGLQRAIGLAEHAVGVLTQQTDSMTAAVGAGGSPGLGSRIDSVSARLSSAQGMLASQAAAAAAASRGIEGFTAPPTDEQIREI
ncbi:MAG TPA: hypothetical protein VMH39_11215, partial [Gemmatimonadaceae bacterium]|nr:hypothetical protein [Gemmatimonadaceae bacterium]